MSHGRKHPSRRDFVRSAALALAATPMLDLDRALVGAAPRSRVALVRTADRRQGVAAAMRVFDPRGIDGRRVVLKPNFNSADEAPASTHNDTLSQIVTELYARGARSIALGESSGPPRTSGVLERKGILDLARDLRFDVVNYEEIADTDWVRFNPEGNHWGDGFYLPRHIVGAEYVVSTCCLKTHGFGGVFTMSLKLSVGLTPKPLRRAMHLSHDMRRMIAELNTGYRPQLIVLDGVVAFTDGGPSRGELKAANVVLVGDDRVAIDAVGLAVLKDVGANRAIMERGIWEQEQIVRAVELGLGAPNADAIELLTADADSRAYAERLRSILARV